ERGPGGWRMIVKNALHISHALLGGSSDECFIKAVAKEHSRQHTENWKCTPYHSFSFRVQYCVKQKEASCSKHHIVSGQQHDPKFGREISGQDCGRAFDHRQQSWDRDGEE